MSLKIISLLMISTLSILNAATPIASYHFDETGWADGATVYDSSREQNHLIAHNEVNRTNISQKVCESAEFDGTNEYMSLSSSSTTNTSLFSFIFSFFGSTDSSEAFWFKTADTNATLLAKELTVGNFELFNQKDGDKSVRIYVDNGKICSKANEYNTSLNTASEICTTNSTYSNDKWYHLSHETTTEFLFFAQKDVELLYIHDENGILLEKVEQENKSIFNFSIDSFAQSTLMLGTSQEANYYSGLLDEVNLYDDSISENEITTLINTTRACANTNYTQDANTQFDAWEKTITESNPETNESARKIYTKIVNSPSFELNVSKINGTIATGTEINITMKIVPTSSCPTGNSDIMSTDTGVVTWKSGETSKLVTFPTIEKAHRDTSIQFEINTTVNTTYNQEQQSNCTLYLPIGCINWSEWDNVASCTTTTSTKCQTIELASIESNLTTTCSTDNFAIRPNGFSSATLDSMPAGTPMVSGHVYNLDILALDASDNNTTGYDQAFSNTQSEIGTWYKLDGTEANRTYAKENGGTDGEFIHEASSQTNFVDGNISNVNYSYSDVGFFDVSMVDRDWAKVDITDNNPDENASVIMSTKTFRVAPYEFNISVNEVRNIDFNTDTNESRFTYLSNSPSLMGARGRIQVDALNARGEITHNYTTGLYENNATIYIKVNTKFQNKDANMSFGNGDNSWYKISDFAAFSKGSLFFDDPNSAHFNYERNSTNYIYTPFLVDGKNIDVNITDNDSILYKDGNFSHPEGNVTFFYGRVNAIDGRVLLSNEDNLGLFVEIYCDSESTDCSAYDVNMTNSPTDFDWYLHFEHNENSVLMFNDTLLVHPRLGTFKDVNITNMYGSADSLVKAYYGSTANEINYDANNTFVNGEDNITIRYTGSQRHTTHIRVTPVTWLEHTSQFKSPTLRFKVTFPGTSGDADNQKSKHAGMGEEGDSNKHMDSNSSKITNRRMSW